MIKNYFKTTLRNLWKNKAYSTINIVGLAIGLTSFLVLLLYLNHELSYDRWHPELGKVYKVSLRAEEDIFNATQAPLAALLRDNASQVEAATSISLGARADIPLSFAEKTVTQTGIISADSLFFKVFPYTIVAGDALNPLNKPNAMVISEGMATKLFGSENPIGKTVKVYNAYECEVTAVMERPEGPTHLDIEVVHRSPNEKNNYHWQNWSYHTYAKTKDHISGKDLESAIDRIYYNEQLAESKGLPYAEFRESGSQEGLFVDAVHDIHNFPKHGSSNMATVSVLLVLATLLLFAGAINFSNLSIASSLRRAKEVGVKKVLGSSRARLFWQFMGEIALQCLIALTISILLLNVALPYFNWEFQVTLSLFGTGVFWSLATQIALCLLLVIALSGLYPAVFLSRYNTAKVLKGDYSTGKRGLTLRNGLIVVQFVVASFFIMGVAVVNSQLNYMQRFDKGFSGEQVVQIRPFMMDTREKNFDAVRNRLQEVPGVQSVSKTTKVPGDVFSDTSTMTFKYQDKNYRIGSVKVSKDYFETLGIQLIDGRLFNDSHADQHTRSVIVNETAAKKMGLQNAGGVFMTYANCDSIPMEVVGVVKDFNVLGLEQQIQPAVFTIGNEACVFQSGGALLVKLASDDVRQPVAAIEERWKTVEPGFGIRLSFLDDNFQQLFASHRRLQRIVTFFGFTAITIAIMGLFALTAFLVGRRTKEISIRKVLGAGVADLGMLLGRDFIRLIAVAVVIAVPIGWWAAHEWLQGFAYRTALNGWLFAWAACAVLAAAAFTVGIHTFKAARANIAANLRDE